MKRVWGERKVTKPRPVSKGDEEGEWVGGGGGVVQGMGLTETAISQSSFSSAGERARDYGK